MYLSLSDCKMNDRLHEESKRFRAIEAIIDYAIDEYRRYGGGYYEVWGGVYVNLIGDDTLEVTVKNPDSSRASAHYTESIADWVAMNEELDL